MRAKKTLCFCALLAAISLAASFACASDVTLDELAEVMPELREAMDSVRLRKNPQYLNNSVIEGRRLPRLALKDLTLSGGRLTGCSLPELRLENVTFENYHFDNTVISNASFKNVTFRNCLFTDSLLVDSALVDCAFSGGALERTKFASHGGRGDFDKNVHERTVFDGSKFSGHFYIGNAEGSLTFRNLRIDEGVSSQGRFFLQGHGLHLYFERCEVGKLDFISVWRGGKVVVKDSIFRGSRFWAGSGTEASFEKCSFSGDTSLDIEGTVPLRDCTAKTGVRKNDKTQLDIQGGEFAAS